MAKVTSKYQVSIPKRLADQLNIGPGDEIDVRVTGEELRITRAGARPQLSVEERLKMFDAAKRRQAARRRRRGVIPREGGRGWTREELYDRGRSR